MEDDFDRFCRIGRGFQRSNHSKNSPQVKSALTRDFLNSPGEFSRNRGGSWHEPREINFQAPLPEFRGSSERSRQKKINFSTGSRTNFYRVSDSSLDRRHSLAPTLAGGTKYHRSSSILADNVNNGSGSRLSFLERKSMPIVPPINVYTENLSNENGQIVRVRSFRRTKAGIVSQGDRDVVHRHEEELSSDGRNVLSVIEQPSDSSVTTRRHSGSTSFLKKFAGRQDVTSLDRVEVARAIRRSSCAVSWTESDHSDLENTSKASSISSYTVQVLGSSQVGKTSMCTQFLSSKSIDVDESEITNDDELMEKVTVDVDGEQTCLLLYDASENIENHILDSADAYLIVYAIDDRESFKYAQLVISEVLGRSKMSSAIVLVGNKADLARSRTISVEEGKNLANVYSCEFYEVSISLNHKVNELLVGLVSAIKSANLRLEEERLRLCRIASLKTHNASKAESPDARVSPRRQGVAKKHSQIGKSIRNFFKKHFSSETSIYNTSM